MSEFIRTKDEVHADGPGWGLNFEADGEPRRVTGFNSKEGGVMLFFERMGYAMTPIALSDEALSAMLEIVTKLLDDRE